MKLSNLSKQNQHTLPSKKCKQAVQLCYQTNRIENQEAHAAKQHNHSQSNQKTKIKNKHSNKHSNKPKQSSHQLTNKRKVTTSKLKITIKSRLH